LVTDGDVEPIHQDRDRAMSFGGVAALYDKARPSYPPALIDTLMAFAPRSVLDIGCGTGKAARLLADRGCDVLGVEPDPSMAALARGHGITVEQATFEQWESASRTFDLIVCGQAWHWMDPEVRGRKAALTLRPGGHLAVFWNRGRPAEVAAPALDAAYVRLAPEIANTNVALHPASMPSARFEEFENAALFDDIAVTTFRWDTVYDRAGWVDFISTHSDHLRLPDARRHALLEAVGEAIDSVGGEMTYHYSTLLVLAKRAD
jgi:SAM-dependent methyltransferase